MLNQTALHPKTPNDGCYVPQGVAFSHKQAAAIKEVIPDAIVFAYITGCATPPPPHPPYHSHTRHARCISRLSLAAAAAPSCTAHDHAPMVHP
jgi:hypothetical protein